MEYTRNTVAVPGTSEHHTGLAIDVCIVKDGVVINENADMIAERGIFAKIHEKLADYGFILRFPEGGKAITGYDYEPWHFRFVGSKDVAKEIADKGLTLEEYLGQVPGETEEADAGETASALLGTWAANEAEGASYGFNEDGKGVWDTGDGFRMHFTYTDKGATVEITYKGSSETQIWKYAIDGDTLTMTDTDTGSVLTYTKK